MVRLPHREHKGSSVCVAAASRIPGTVGHWADPLVLRCQAFQGGVDRLLLRGDQAYLHLAIVQGKYLRSQHGRVRDAQQLPLPLVRVAAGDDKEPRAVGRGVQVRRLHGSVEAALVRRQQLEIALCRGCQGLDGDLQRVVIDAIQQVKEQRADLRVGQKEGHDVPLPQIGDHTVIVRKIAIVHQRLVEPDERVRSARVPDPPLGGVSLVGDPDVGLQVLQLVVGCGLLGIAHDLKDQQVPPV